MFENGLLVMTTAVLQRGSGNILPGIIQSCARKVRNLLYVHLVNLDSTTISSNTRPDVMASEVKPLLFSSPSFTQPVRQLITDFYAGATNIRNSLQVRFLVGNISNVSLPATQLLHYGYNIILTDVSRDLHRCLADYAYKRFPVSQPVEVFQVAESQSLSTSDATGATNDSISRAPSLVQMHRSVCLGGTFDRLHVGHHILLTEGCLLAMESLLVGVTDGDMNKNKVLNELMQSTDERIESIRDFVTDIRPDLQYNIVPINDPFGPPITDPNFDCIVVSSETVRGAEAINKRRAGQGMKQLAVEIIELVADSEHAAEEEEKISSSSTRKRLLGTLLRPSLKAVSSPFVIGLTGSTASGKSSVCKRLERLGAAIIDCDKLGHQSYEPGTETHRQLVAEFGSEIVSEDGSIDRRRLSARVFKNKDDLSKLNSIVWPAIQRLCSDEVTAAAEAGKEVIVLDAAVLLEAGWDKMVHEVWTTVIPVNEAVRRLVERNGLTEDDALRRINSQMSNSQRVGRANVVLCTLWHPDVTQIQVEKAWGLLHQRLNTQTPV